MCRGSYPCRNFNIKKHTYEDWFSKDLIWLKQWRAIFVVCYNSTVAVTHSRTKRWWRRVIRRRSHKEIETEEKSPWFVRDSERQETKGEGEEVNRGTEKEPILYCCGITVEWWSFIFHRLQTCILFRILSEKYFGRWRFVLLKFRQQWSNENDMWATNMMSQYFNLIHFW